MQQFGGGVGGAGFASTSPVFVPTGGLGAVDTGGLLGDIDSGFKVRSLPMRQYDALCLMYCRRVWIWTGSTTAAVVYSVATLRGEAGVGG